VLARVLDDAILKKEAAEILGVSPGRVSQLITAGVLQEVAGRKLSRAQVLQAKANAAIRWHTPGVKSGPKPKPPPAAPAAPPTRSMVRQVVAELPAGAIPPIEESRARHEHYRALITELEHSQKTGALLDREEVFRQWATHTIIARDAMLAIPSRVTDEVCSLVCDVSREARAQIANLISKEITFALENLSSFDGVNRTDRS
jgi:hypothetical protein